MFHEKWEWTVHVKSGEIFLKIGIHKHGEVWNFEDICDKFNLNGLYT